METTKYNTNTNTAKHSGALWVQFGCSFGAVLQNCTQWVQFECSFAKLHPNCTQTAPKVHHCVWRCLCLCCILLFPYICLHVCVKLCCACLSLNCYNCILELSANTCSITCVQVVCSNSVQIPVQLPVHCQVIALPVCNFRFTLAMYLLDTSYICAHMRRFLTVIKPDSCIMSAARESAPTTPPSGTTGAGGGSPSARENGKAKNVVKSATSPKAKATSPKAKAKTKTSAAAKQPQGISKKT